MNLKDMICQGSEIFYVNKNLSRNLEHIKYSKSDIEDAESRLNRFAPYLAVAFDELKSSDGIIESPIVKLDNMNKFLKVDNPVYLKLDSHLPVSGSVKARGGIYEVLKVAEKIAISHGLLSYDDDYSKIVSNEFKNLFSKYKIAVGSTGNLGLSIGIISAKLGFQVTVHMSSDAKEWKKTLLREKGCQVIEYPDDYEKAVASGRAEALNDEMCHFIDDENSIDLFLGYSVAGKRLFKQIVDLNIEISEKHPLHVYLPCGVGGAPGGIAFGIKSYFGHCAKVYFVEPVNAPCMALGNITGLGEKISVKDIGLSGKTLADGLAVGRASKLVSSMSNYIIDGFFTINDSKLYPMLKALYNHENIFIEPSACIGFNCIKCNEKYLKENNMPIGTHLIWATGGNMVPENEKEMYINGVL